MAIDIQQSEQEPFNTNLQNWWQELVAQIKHDAAKMNAGISPRYGIGLPAMKGKIEINGRESLPGWFELHIDKPPFPLREDKFNEPPISLTIRLDIDEKEFQVLRHRTRGPYAYGKGKNENVESIAITSVSIIAHDERVRILAESGLELKIETLSEGILNAFLVYPTRCGVKP